MIQGGVMTEDREEAFERLHVLKHKIKKADADWDEMANLMDLHQLDECGGCGAVIDNSLPHCISCNMYDVNGLNKSDFY
jgi:hypothetical protein